MNKTPSSLIKEDISTIANSLLPEARKLEGKKIVITGGAGFLGSYMIQTIQYLNEEVLKKSCKIICIDNYITSTKTKLTRNNITYIDHDINKPIKIHGKIDYIVHAAGIASPIYYQKYPLQTIDVAVDGTRNMLELANKKNVKSILYFSSSEVYGDPPADAIPTKETYRGNVSSIGSRACYDESKRLGETLCMTYFRVFKTPVKIVRPFNIYGPGMKIHDYRVVPTFIARALRKKKIPIYTEGKQTRAFCYVTDAVSGFLTVLLSNKNGEVYNVGNDKTEVSMNELAQRLNKIFHGELLLEKTPYPKDYPQDEPRRRCPSLEKINNELDYSPKVGLTEGLKKTVIWCEKYWKN